MIVGENSRADDLDVNVTRKETDEHARLDGRRRNPAHAARVLNLEQAMEFINEDELVEVTRQTIRLRKKVLPAGQRPWRKQSNRGAAAPGASPPRSSFRTP